MLQPVNILQIYAGFFIRFFSGAGNRCNKGHYISEVRTMKQIGRRDSAENTLVAGSDRFGREMLVPWCEVCPIGMGTVAEGET